MARPSKYDRDKVATAIMNTFWEHGYEATSLDRLEKATGLKRTSLYNAFGDKQAMFKAALDRYNNTVGTPLVAMLEQGDPRAGIEAFFNAQYDMLSDVLSPPGCLATGSTNELGYRCDALGALVQTKTTAHAAALAEVFSGWQHAGKIDPEADPAALAALLLALSNGISTLSRTGADSPLARQAHASAVTAFDRWIPSP
ncbi:TetR/AcrR family transcriptional regulator [Kordiimonas aestuarii]|uniref:TetR/AcrR family transcriptional regulator n=1 Tax=Kordiimonas aestuarii TaxID=1005925 RepID=UPI0021CF7DAD|nr:TetR/AcrR family transcriptional regulator [Kordiimonas aestuarii]